MPRKHRRESDPIRDIVVVETSDGARLRCSIAAVGRGLEPRWMILDAKGQQFVGPLATSDRTAEGVSKLVGDWWAQRGASEPHPKTKGTSPKA